MLKRQDHLQSVIIRATIAAAFTCIAMSPASARLRAPSPEVQANNDETAARKAFADKAASYKLCLAQDRVAAAYMKSRAALGQPVVPPAGLPACQDPGNYEATQAAAKVGIADALPLNKEPVKKP